MSDLSLRRSERSCGQLEDAEAALPRQTESPWAHVGHDIDDMTVGVHHEDIDIEAHPARMNASARHNQQSVARIEMVARQQAHRALDPPGGDIHAIGEDSAPVDVFRNQIL